MTVFIAYGWPEGSWHGKQFRKALMDYGYKATESSAEADIIIAHSAGCYMLPANTKAKLILLIGLPNWPNKLLMKCTFEKVSIERKNAYWFNKTFWHLVYGALQPIRLYNVYKTYRQKYLPDFKQSKVVLVHNQQDTYMQVENSQKLAKERKWLLINLNGQHDDMWQNTQPYIELVGRYLS